MWKSQLNKRKFYNRNKEFDLPEKLGGNFGEMEHGLQLLAQQPFFAKVNNRTVVTRGETAFLPCRVKFIQPGYMGSIQEISSLTFT